MSERLLRDELVGTRSAAQIAGETQMMPTNERPFQELAEIIARNQRELDELNKLNRARYAREARPKIHLTPRTAGDIRRELYREVAGTADLDMAAVERLTDELAAAEVKEEYAALERPLRSSRADRRYTKEGLAVG